MSLASVATFRQRRTYEQTAARYTALLAKTRDPGRRQMLEEMIARELDAVAQTVESPVHDDAREQR